MRQPYHRDKRAFLSLRNLTASRSYLRADDRQYRRGQMDLAAFSPSNPKSYPIRPATWFLWNDMDLFVFRQKRSSSLLDSLPTFAASVPRSRQNAAR